MQAANRLVRKEITPVVLGRIAGIFGVKGWVKVFSYTEPREAILDFSIMKTGC
jgi:16S rRNA processing protein RimM